MNLVNKFKRGVLTEYVMEISCHSFNTEMKWEEWNGFGYLEKKNSTLLGWGYPGVNTTLSSKIRRLNKKIKTTFMRIISD